MNRELTNAEKLIARLSWSSKPSGEEHVVIQVCPFCLNDNWKFYIHIGGEKDGVFDCKVCAKTGNLTTLRKHLGDDQGGMTSVSDLARQRTGPAPLPDFDAMHWRLLNDTQCEDVLDYLVADRKFSMDALKTLKIGADVFDGKKWFIIPYYNHSGTPVYYKGRSVPPAQKAFRSPAGREAALYNETAITQDMDELIIVEGEADAISLVSQGYTTVVGVPGANTRKAAWIERLDHFKPKKLYLLYDNDRVGQAAAHEMAIRIGIEKPLNIVLPPFKVVVDGTERPGKDINDWFIAGKTMEEFTALKDAAKAFNVQGVQNLADVLADLKADIEGRGIEPTYKTPWPSLDKRLGGVEPGDLIGIMAEGKVGKTTMALNWLQYYSESIGIPTMMFCLEMPPKRMVRKWVSMVTQTDDTPGASQITKQVVDVAIEIGGAMRGDMLFGFTRINKPDEIFETIRQAVRRYGVKIVCFDNLQLLVRSIEHSAQETAKFTKQFKELAMELNIVLILVIQPNRVAEGQIIASRNAMNSSAIEKDVDAMICLHRNRVAKIRQEDFRGFMDTDENFEPNMLVRVDLSRYAAGGVTTLIMDGARSTVREYTDQVPLGKEIAITGEEISI